MLTDQHPITPPPELVREWNEAAIGTHFPPYGYSEYIATQAARWGADQELEACCSWADATGWYGAGDMLRAARRPKPPGLAEEALLAIDTAVADNRISAEIARVTRAALKRLQELESNG